MESLTNLPLGYRFDPLDRELIQYYLIPKVEHDSSFDCHGVITEANVFGLQPEILARKARYVPGDGNLYFFADRTCQDSKGTAKRAKRTLTLADGDDSDGGRWTCRDRPHPVFNQEGEQIGTRRTLTYYKKNETRPTSWRIHEFTLEVQNKKSHNSSSSLLGKRKGDGFLDHVICRLFLQPAEACSRKQLQRLLEEEPRTTSDINQQQCLPQEYLEQNTNPSYSYSFDGHQHSGGAMETQPTTYHQYPPPQEQQQQTQMETQPTTYDQYLPPREQQQQTQTEMQPVFTTCLYPEQQQDEVNAQATMQQRYQSFTELLHSELEIPDFEDDSLFMNNGLPAECLDFDEDGFFK